MAENVLSLFSGAGGAVEGFKQAGYDVSTAVDFDEDCIDTLKTNHDDVQVIKENLAKVNPVEFAEKHTINAEDVDVVVGGPPCQGFSIAGNRDINDERNTLIEDFLDYAEYYEPRAVIMENVVGILSMEDGRVKEYLLDRLKTMGYDASVDVHNATNYGVPQRRKRALFIGTQSGGDMIEPPGNGENVVTIEDVLSRDFSNCPNNDGVNSREETIKRMDALKYGESLNDGETPRRLYPNRPSWTLTSSGSPPIHPHEPRKLTHRELASIQSFPKEYKFCGGKQSVMRQIGNASPPKMMKNIAESL